MSQDRICATALKRWRKGEPDWMREINSATKAEREEMIIRHIAPAIHKVMAERESFMRGSIDVVVTPFEFVHIHPNVIASFYKMDPEWRDLMKNRRRWRGKRSKRVREAWASIEKQIMDKSEQAFIKGKELHVFRGAE